MELENISRESLIRSISDPDIPLEKSLAYLQMHYDADHCVTVDAIENKLVVDDTEPNPLTQANIAFQWVVKAIRTRRQKIFFSRLHNASSDPIVVLDGDSWAQHPFVDEMFDHLSKHCNVYCSSLAGRLLQELHDENMYLEMLSNIEEEGHLKNVKAIILSGGGNDLFGEQFTKIVKPFDKDNPDDATAHINQAKYDALLKDMGTAYRNIIRKIGENYKQRKFNIILHSYTYLTPWDTNTNLLPKDKWVGDPLRKKGISQLSLQKNIIVELLDQFHLLLESIVQEFPEANVTLLDNRTAIPGNAELWSDEIHPSSKGFKRVSDSILSAITTT